MGYIMRPEHHNRFATEQKGQSRMLSLCASVYRDAEASWVLRTRQLHLNSCDEFCGKLHTL